MEVWHGSRERARAWAQIFSGGVDKGALHDGTMSALGGVGGDDNGALIAFGLKALTLLLQCQTPEAFIQAGIKLATDPNFPKVCEKLFEVATELGGAIAENVA